MKKAIALVMTLAMTLSLAACGGSEETTTQPAETTTETTTGSDYSDYTIGLITTIGGLGDASIGDEGYNGCKAAQEALGFNFDYSEPMTAQDLEALVMEYSDSGEYDLIITLGNESFEVVQTMQPDYPDQNYLVYDIDGEIENAVTEWFSKVEIGFMSGVFMALMEAEGEVTINGNTTTWDPSHTYGLVIGSEFPSTVTALTGAAAGLKYVDDQADYKYAIVGDWKDQGKNKEVALAIYDEGAHFIFHNAGGGSFGIVEAAKETGNFFIGYDGNQNVLDADHVVASSIKCNADVILRVLTQFCENGGELEWATSEENGYPNAGIGFVYQDGLEVPENVAAIMDEIQAQLKAGELEIPATWEEVDAFTATYAG